MQYLRGIYDSSSHRLMVEFNNVLLENHWDLFSELIAEASKKSYLPKNTEFKKVSSEKALIVIPYKLEGAENLEDGDRIENLPSQVTEHLSNVLESFSKKAVDLEMKNLEFMPLSGYSLDQMKEDLIQAIKDKRDLVLIDTYSNYKKLVQKETTETNQCVLKYLDNDYADVAYLIYSGNLSELKKYKSKLEVKRWI